MTGAVATARLAGHLDEALAVRSAVNERFFTAEAHRIARLCHRMAERFVRGGRLLALGASPQDRSDARHVAVEFVHPVIVGKRSLPALAIVADGGSLAGQTRLLAGPDDMAIAFAGAGDGDAAEALRVLRERGCLTVAVGAPGAEWGFDPPAPDAFVRQELGETLYHVLWELVHVFFEHRGLLGDRPSGPVHDAGASAFLYPFLAEGERDVEAVTADVRRSVALKAAEVGALRAKTLAENRGVLIGAAGALRRSFDGGGTLFLFGNGGSATDAADAAADFRAPPAGWPARRAIDLTEDSAVLTALANDIGADAQFARQLIAHGRSGDAALALSTSGNSGSIVEALREARRRGLATVAMVGYDGGRVAAEALADHVIVTRSEHIPRIQEAQASAYHVLRELVEMVPGDDEEGP